MNKPSAQKKKIYVKPSVSNMSSKMCLLLQLARYMEAVPQWHKDGYLELRQDISVTMPLFMLKP